MSIRKVILMMIAGFLAAGLAAGLLEPSVNRKDDMLTRAEANRMVDEAVRQAEIDIRARLDAEDATVTAAEEPAPAEETTPEAEQTAEETPEEAPQIDHPVYKYTVINNALNYREGPGTSYRVIGYVPVGYTGYAITPVEENFSLVVCEGYVAYMHAHYLKFEEVSPEEYPKEYLPLTAEDAGKVVNQQEASESGDNDNQSRATESRSSSTGAAASNDSSSDASASGSAADAGNAVDTVGSPAEGSTAVPETTTNPAGSEEVDTDNKPEESPLNP